MCDKIFSKLLSGRYCLTVIAGITFAYAVYSGILNSEATAAIITMVFINYFQRDRKTDTENETEGGSK